MKTPYKSRKIRNKACYQVKNKTTKRKFSFCTTREKGKRQTGYLTAWLQTRLGIPLI